MGMVDLTHDLGIGGLELVNTFFPSPQYGYLKQLRQRADDARRADPAHHVRRRGQHGGAREGAALLAAKNHHKWIDIAAVLGCHSIRCNTGAREGDADALDRCAESFAALVEYADAAGINVLDREPLGAVVRTRLAGGADGRRSTTRASARCPTSATSRTPIDRYDAVRRMMPCAKAVSAKCYDFDDAGNETKIDFATDDADRRRRRLRRLRRHRVRGRASAGARRHPRLQGAPASGSR